MSEKEDFFKVAVCKSFFVQFLILTFPLPEGTVRLTPDSGFGTSLASTNNGRLEIYAGGQWGTVCDDGFTQGDATVACNQLGFLYASSYGDVFSSYV